jgi:hypothetical protein
VCVALRRIETSSAQAYIDDRSLVLKGTRLPARGGRRRVDGPDGDEQGPGVQIMMLRGIDIYIYTASQLQDC